MCRWRRKKGHFGDSKTDRSRRNTTGGQISFLFFNFPEVMQIGNLWRIFKRYGTVTDIYLARRPLKCGKKFGFVRFKKEGGELHLGRELNNIWIGLYKMRVFRATDKTQSEDRYRSFVDLGRGKIEENHRRVSADCNLWADRKRDVSRSYAKVLMEGRKKEEERVRQESNNQEDILGDWSPERELEDYLNRCLVGEINSLDNMEAIRKLSKEKAVGISDLKTLGGRQVLLKCSNEISMNGIIQNKLHGLHHWIKDLSRWTPGYRNAERLVWIKIYGVPLHGWKENIFTDIAAKWGKVLKTMNCSLEESSNLSWGKVLISTFILSPIDALKSIKVGGFFYRVKVEEEDSSLLGVVGWEVAETSDSEEGSDEERISPPSSKWSDIEEGSEEEEEGVEETWLEGGMGDRNPNDRSSPAKTEMAGDGIAGNLGGILGGGEKEEKMREKVILENENDNHGAPLSGGSRAAPIDEGVVEVSKEPPNKIPEVFDLGVDMGQNYCGPNKGTIEHQILCDGPIHKKGGCSFSKPNEGGTDAEKDQLSTSQIRTSSKVNQHMETEANCFQPVESKECEKRKTSASADQGGIGSTGGTRLIGKPKQKRSEGVTLGSGRASFHVMKKLARKNGKRGISQKGKQVTSTGERREKGLGVSQTSSSNEVGGKEALDGIEDFGTTIGMEWNRGHQSEKQNEIRVVEEPAESGTGFGKGIKHPGSKFDSNRGPRWGLISSKKISVEEASDLERPFEEDEIWAAIKSCGGDKSPGPDGFTFGFFKAFWEIVKEDLIRAVKWFWEKGELGRGCNASFITLIPKVDAPSHLGEFRPISLIGSFYKILAKILAERIKGVMGKIINSSQSAFIKGRYILDGILIANEIVDYVKKKKKEGFIFKVDFEKAYDSVEWPFLLDCLLKMGFGAKWVSWIEACLKSSSISVLVNGSPTLEFPMKRGLRQGDPLAPFLFLIVSIFLWKMRRKKAIFEGIKVGKLGCSVSVEPRISIHFSSIFIVYGTTVSHLQYADDVVFFGKWKSVNFRNLLKILVCFQELSGLKINVRKSRLFGLGVTEEDVRRWATSAGCGFGKLPFLYLGLPVGASMKRLDHWKEALDKIQKRLESWKSRFVSFGGRLMLVKSVLGSLPLYFFSMFRAPSGVIKECERLRCRFFWGGGGGEGVQKGKVWVKWTNTLKNYKKGGLNIGSLESMNLSLLGKWWSRFLNEKEALWVKVITSLYGVGGGGLFGKNVGFDGAGNSWSSIIRVGTILDSKGVDFTRSFVKKLGDGISTKMWKERWLGLDRLQDVFPRLFRLEVDNSASVAERGEWVDGEWRWSWKWRREPRGRELGELEDLTARLTGIAPNIGGSDKTEWKLDGSGSYTVKKMRELLGTQENESGVVTNWTKILPKKVCIFMWRVGWNRLPCRVFLDKVGVDLDSVLCPRCGEMVESMDHALVMCREVKPVWNRVGMWWGKNLDTVSSVQELLNEDSSPSWGVGKEEVWLAVKWSFMYFIWRHRNSLVFERSSSIVHDKVLEMQRQSFEWISKRSKGWTIHWEDWLADPTGGGSRISGSIEAGFNPQGSVSTGTCCRGLVIVHGVYSVLTEFGEGFIRET
ncbi:LOW QUALITY PROTEIN: hypothetical protein OSB04_027541 [Centaurea solstitialis]|uniref:Reverse transcriptase domain-containing protein n=1 Tax=Centaurea solstitialis TaxID=347529 RepID=A0AA38SE27_9ASTR|nr:LOW QUALITY PROTEIN: hypothetical protein OSB04_027541 [Centaurea solstitialis]